MRIFLILMSLLSVFLNAEDISTSTWVKKPDVVNPVALTFDYQGKAYVLNASRRGGGSLDIRRIPQWVHADLKFQSVEERQQFYRQHLKPETSSQNKRIVKYDFNEDGLYDWRDLAFNEDPITTHRATDASGLADEHGNVKNPVASEASGLAAGVLWHDGHLYLMHEPDLWKYSDSNGDGHFDKRECLSTGYSVHIGQGGHNTSGLAIGLDGRLYWSVADKGFNATSSDGQNRHVYPHRGGIMRCELDGSNLEVFAYGVRNAQELAFDKFGHLFSVDNDGDYPTERERFLYLIEGGETGWRLHWQWHRLQKFATISGEKPYNVWMEEKMSVPYNNEQPAYIVPPLKNYKNGPCGITYNPGAALSSHFKDNFFHASSGDITAFRVEPKGASFEMVDEKVIARGKTLTGLAFGPDGALYAGSCLGYPNYPSKNGFVLKVDSNDSDLRNLRSETAKILATGFRKSPVEQLYENLHHADLRVRRDSQFELVRRGHVGFLQLMKAAKKGRSTEARMHALWGLGQLARHDQEYAVNIMPYLYDKDLEVQAVAIRVIGDAHYKKASSVLIDLLSTANLRQQSLIAISLGKLQDKHAVSKLFDLAEKNNGDDPYLRHALVMGLAGSAKEDRHLLTEVSKHSSREVRLCAILSLRRLSDSSIKVYLDDQDESLVTEVARAIHDDFSIPLALPELAMLLEREGLENEALIRRSINANLRLGGSKNAAILKKFIVSEKSSLKMKTTALACFAFWKNPTGLDAVEGRYRQYQDRSLQPALTSLNAITTELENFSPRFRSIFLRVVNRLNTMELAPLLIKLYRSTTDLDFKVELLSLLAKMKVPEFKQLVSLAEKSDHEKLRYTAASLMGKVSLKSLEKQFSNGDVHEKREALKKIASFPGERAEQLLIKYLEGIISWKNYRELALEIVAESKKRAVNNLEINGLISKFYKKTSKGMARYRSVSYGGDSEKGKNIAMGHPGAQCIRCHKIGQVGGILGPDLSKIAKSLSREHLVQALVDPSASLAEGYGVLSLELKDKSLMNGTYKGESKSSYELQQPDGTPISVSKSKVNGVSHFSPMPSMKAILSEREIRDLVEYLSTLK